MSEKTLLTKRVRNAFWPFNYIPIYRIVSDEDGNITKIQFLDDSGQPLSVGDKYTPIYYKEGQPTPIEATEWEYDEDIDEQVVQLVKRPEEAEGDYKTNIFTIVNDLQTDATGRLSGITATTYTLPQASIFYGVESDIVEDETVVWIDSGEGNPVTKTVKVSHSNPSDDNPYIKLWIKSPIAEDFEGKVMRTFNIIQSKDSAIWILDKNAKKNESGMVSEEQTDETLIYIEE